MLLTHCVLLVASPFCLVQGTDARLSGHFTYSTTPAFMELRLAPALRCTNRSEVQVGVRLA